MLSLLALAAGGLIWHTADAIAVVIALVLVVLPLVSLIPGTTAATSISYRSTVVGQLVTQADAARV